MPRCSLSLSSRATSRRSLLSSLSNSPPRVLRESSGTDAQTPISDAFRWFLFFRGRRAGIEKRTRGRGGEAEEEVEKSGLFSFPLLFFPQKSPPIFRPLSFSSPVKSSPAGSHDSGSRDSDQGAFATERDIVGECIFASLTRAEPPESGDDCVVVVIVIIGKASCVGVSPRCCGDLLDLFSPPAPLLAEEDAEDPRPPPRLRRVLLLLLLGSEPRAARRCRCRRFRSSSSLALGRLGGRREGLRRARGRARRRGRGVGARRAARVAALLRGPGEGRGGGGEIGTRNAVRATKTARPAFLFPPTLTRSRSLALALALALSLFSLALALSLSQKKKKKKRQR